MARQRIQLAEPLLQLHLMLTVQSMHALPRARETEPRRVLADDIRRFLVVLLVVGSFEQMCRAGGILPAAKGHVGTYRVESAQLVAETAAWVVWEPISEGSFAFCCEFCCYCDGEAGVVLEVAAVGAVDSGTVLDDCLVDAVTQRSALVFHEDSRLWSVRRKGEGRGM